MRKQLRGIYRVLKRLLEIHTSSKFDCTKKTNNLFSFFRLMAANPSLSEQSAHILLERGLVQVEGGTSLFMFVMDVSLRNRWVHSYLTVLFSCRSWVLPRLSYQSGRLLLHCTSSSLCLFYFSHRSYMQPIKCMFVVCMFSEKHSTHQLGAESRNAVEDQRLGSNCSVRYYCSTMISLLLTLKSIHFATKYNFCLFRADNGFDKIFFQPDLKKFTSALLQAYRERNVSVFYRLLESSRHACISVFIFSC